MIHLVPKIIQMAKIFFNKPIIQIKRKEIHRIIRTTRQHLEEIITLFYLQSYQ